MTEEEAKNILTAEGFGDINVWEDEANFEYSDHTHEKLTAHIILAGEMTLVDSAGKTDRLAAGQRLDIPAGTTHRAKMGPAGCRYVVGEK